MTAVESSDPGTAACPCGADGMPPWRTRDELFSPASIFFAVPYFVLLLLIWPSPKGNLVGLTMAGLALASVVGATVVALTRGHRPWCAVRRGTWIGIAILGLPLRMLASLSI
ncbi:hypothetical protein [Nocardioides houyundeii]|uniref:hypothetical protein n=1 Tax=Nocardioides houyundeii TaxID=2045452 RepID=UPI000C79069F|nr:hypothetical protein [Nocardioides houyundeii]